MEDYQTLEFIDKQIKVLQKELKKLRKARNNRKRNSRSSILLRAYPYIGYS